MLLALRSPRSTGQPRDPGRVPSHQLFVAGGAGVWSSGQRVSGASTVGATIIVIDHDLDLLAAADHLIDMGPGGGPDGGRIVAAGSPGDVARAPESVTGPWLAATASSLAHRVTRHRQ
jgi:hypothetical protein